MASELVTVGVELLAAVARLIMDAVSERDPSKLRRVTDVLEPGHPLRSRIALLEAQAAAERALHVGG
ncbi:MAG: hypothetical protein WC554_11730 [Clostridia bacterium]|jgi:hypothetical protein